jgi:bla regulator protein BlaR1
VKQLPVFDLVVMKGGIKFRESAVKSGAEGCKGWTSSNGTNLKMECVQIDGLTRYLSSYLHKTVIDKTGMPTTSGYDATFKWRHESDAAPSDADLQLPTIYTALQEQLGLKLENSKGPVDTLVIDQLDKPTEN